MKMNFRAFFCMAVVLITACQSSNDNDPHMAGGAITVNAVTGSSDKYVYIDDVITVTGNGFDPDASKDSVEVMVANEFGDFQAINYQGSGHYFINESAAANTIRFKVPEDQLQWFNAQVYASNYQYGFRVRANGAVSEVFTIHVRRIFSFNFTYGDINTAINIAAGGGVSIDGKYFTDDCTMKISLVPCGKSDQCEIGDFSRCDCDSFVSVPCSGWAYNYKANDGTYANMTASFPLSVFGVTEQDCGKDVKFYQTKVRIENKDGKVAIGYCWVYYRPC